MIKRASNSENQSQVLGFERSSCFGLQTEFINVTLLGSCMTSLSSMSTNHSGWPSLLYNSLLHSCIRDGQTHTRLPSQECQILHEWATPCLQSKGRWGDSYRSRNEGQKWEAGPDQYMSHSQVPEYKTSGASVLLTEPASSPHSPLLVLWVSMAFIGSPFPCWSQACKG